MKACRLLALQGIPKYLCNLWSPHCSIVTRRAAMSWIGRSKPINQCSSGELLTSHKYTRKWCCLTLFALFILHLFFLLSCGCAYGLYTLLGLWPSVVYWPNASWSCAFPVLFIFHHLNTCRCFACFTVAHGTIAPFDSDARLQVCMCQLC